MDNQTEIKTPPISPKASSGPNQSFTAPQQTTHDSAPLASGDLSIAEIIELIDFIAKDEFKSVTDI